MTRLVPAMLMALSVATADAQGSDVAIVGFRPETAALTPGNSATSAIDVENRGRTTRRVWIGYSVGAPDGVWYDVTPVQVELPPGARATQQLSWTVPLDPQPPAGNYRVVMAVWAARPGTDDATRLASVDRRDAFRVESTPMRLGAGQAWHAGDHRLGRGRVIPSGVQWSSDGFRLRLEPNGCDGAEIRTVERYRFGEFAARMRTPVAPGSLSALFLYADQANGNDEIDIEVHNDGSRRAILTGWIAGRETRSAEVTLPFDPAAAEHEYAIRWTHAELSFFADGKRLGGWTSRFPQSPMRLMANVWWPTWLACHPLTSAVDLVIPTIRVDTTGVVR